MAYDIGTARGVIEMEYNGRGVTQAQQDLQSLDDKGKKSGITLDEAGKKAGRAGFVVAAGLGAAIATAANFEQRMSAVKAVSGASASEMEQLSNKALDLGAKTSFSAGEAASAIEELVKAGLSVPDVMNGAADATVALAAAGEIALPEAAAIASNAMNQFNLSAADMPKVADDIAGAANASAIDVSDFGQSLQQAGAVANLAGIDFKDTATAIAIMGNAGIKGSDAGTSLKSMFSRLQPTTNKQITLMEDLGLLTLDAGKSMELLRANGVQPLGKDQGTLNKQMGELGATLSDSEVGSAKALKKMVELQLQSGALSNAFYDQEGNTKGLAQISGTLAKSMEGMTKQQKQATLQTLFGSDAIRAAAILSNEGAKGFNKMSDALSKTTAAEVAATRLDNFKGSLEAMMGSLETLGITLGTLLLPPLRQLVDALTQAVNWFTGLGKGTQTAIVAALAFVAAALLIVSAVIKIILIAGKVQATMVALRGTFIATWLAALGPIALIIAAVAAVVAIVVLLWKKNETFRNAVLAVWNAIKTAVAAVLSWFTGTLVPGIVSAWTAIVSAATTAWHAIVAVITTVFNMIVAVVKAYINIILAPWRAMWALFGPIVKAVFALIVAIIRLAWTIIKGVVLAGIAVVKGAVSAGFNAVRSVTAAAWGAIRGAIASAWGAIKGVVMPAVNAVKSVISAAWDVVKSKTSTMWNALKGIISGAIAGLMVPINGIKDKVLSAINFGAEMYAKGKEMIQSLIDGISSMIGKVTDVIDGITSKIGKFLPGSPVKEGPLKKLNRGHAGKEIVKMVIGGIEKMSVPLTQSLDGVMPVPATAGAAGAPRGTVKRKGSGTGPRAVRLSGDLSLVNGRAYISGIAEDVFDDFNDDNNRRG